MRARTVVWRMMFRANDRRAAEHCLERVLRHIAAVVSERPKPYWKMPELWEASLQSDFTGGSDALLALLQVCEALASGWYVFGLNVLEGEVDSFCGVYDGRKQTAHVAGLQWASFDVVPSQELQVDVTTS